MKYQYIGDGSESPEKITFFGHKFVLKGAYVDVTNEVALSKIDGIKTFKKKEEPKKEEPKKAVKK